jgi:cell division septal protein FtsQ
MEVEGRTGGGVELPKGRSAAAGAPGDRILPLELRLRQHHQRRRRAAIRRLIATVCWGVGLLGVVAFVLALSLGAAPR